MDVFELFAILKLKTDEYKKGLNEAKDDAEKGGSKIGTALGTAAKVGGAALVAATGAAVAFGKSSVEAGMNFDASMSNVRAISGANAEQFDQLREKAQEMGATTKFSATESADAMSYMAMAGWKTEDMLNGISGIMNLAAASGEDLATTSDIVTDALTAFGMQASDSGRFADILAAAATNANTNVGMMGETFKYAAPLAGALGYTAEDVAVAIGLMANSGVKASQAGTSLRSMLTRLAKEPEEAAVAMEALGISLQNDEGEMYSFMELMKNMRTAFHERLVIPEEEVEAALADLGEQFEAGKISQSEYDEGVERLTERAYGAEGALMAQYAAMLGGQQAMSGLLAIVNSTDEDFEKLTNSIQHSSDAMVMTADGSIMSMNQALEEGIEYVQEFNGAAAAMSSVMQDNLVGDITIFKSALEGAKIAISDKLSPTLREFVEFGTDGLSRLTMAFQSDGLSGAMDELGSILSDFIAMISDKLPKIVEAGGKLLMSLLEGILQNLPQIAEAAVQIVTTLANGLAEKLPQLMETMADVVVQLVSTLTNPDTLNSLLEAGLNIITALADGIMKAAPKLLEALPELIHNIVAFLIASIPTIVEAGFKLFTSLVENLPNIITAIVKVLPDLITGIVTGLLDGIPMMIEGGVKLLSSIVSDLPKIIANIVKAVPKIVAGLAEGLVKNSGKILESGVKLIESLISGIVKSIPMLIQIAPQIVKGFAEGIVGAVGVLVDAGKHIIDKIRETFSNIVNGAKQWGIDMIKNFIDGIKSQVSGVANAVSGVASKVKSFLGFSEPEKGPLSNFSTYAPDMMKLFAQGIKDNAYLITDQIEKSFDFGSKLVPAFDFPAGAGSSTTNTYNITVNGIEELEELLEWYNSRQVRARMA